MANEAPLSTAAVARLERVPPHSEEAERGVLGAVLLDAEKVMDLCIERQLVPESFYIPAHRSIYEVLLAMSREAVPIDLLTVNERLKGVGILDRLGGPTALNRIVDATPTSAHAEYYIDIVRDRYLLRRVIETSREIEKDCYQADADAQAVLSGAEQAFFDITVHQHGQMPPWSDLVNEVVRLLDSGHKGMMGLSTGFKDIDRCIEGLKPSNMIILAARPSMGKTSLAMNIVENVALGRGDPERRPRAVGVFSLEMSCVDLVKRMICSKAEVSMQKLGAGFLSKVDNNKLINAADALISAPILLDDTAGLEISEIRARARRMKVKHQVELIVVDYLQLLRAPEYSKQSRQVEISMVSAGLKGMAKELNVPVLVLSQLSRAAEQRDKTEKPKLSDLRDSGSIEQDADIVMFLQRPSRIPNHPNHDDQTLALVDVAKNRNGPTGDDIRLEFRAEYTRFLNAMQQGVDEAGMQPSYLQEEQL
jgi:replicative DNA helicase